MKKLYGAVAIWRRVRSGFRRARCRSRRADRTRTERAHIRTADIHGTRRKARRPARAIQEPHDAHLQEARDREHRVLRAASLQNEVAPPRREAADQDWAAFQKDPEWQKVANESQVNGKIVAKVERVFLNATDYSPMK